MGSVTQYELAWELYRKKVKVLEIGEVVGRDRATVFRWISGIKKVGIREFVRVKKTAKRRRQPRKISVDISRRIIEIRREFDWCGQKIQKELAEKDEITICLMSVYRVLKPVFKIGSKWRKYKDRGEAPKATAPRQVVQHDTVYFGQLFAFTSIDIFTKEPAVIIGTDLTSASGVMALQYQQKYFGKVSLHQSDEGPEFKGQFPATVKSTGADHRYARPYKKNDQSYLENFNRSLRKECLGWGKYLRADRASVQERVNHYLEHWINDRWHMGLPNMQTPAQFSREWYAKRNQIYESVAFAL